MSAFEANVFEDDGGIRRETGFLRRLSQLQVIQDGGLMPDGYGICWTRWNTADVICAPMPWHLVIGAAYRAYHAFRRGFGMPDARAAEAYNRGRHDAERYLDARLREARRQYHAQYLLTYEHAYNNGAKDQLDSLLRQLDARQKGSLD